VKPSKGIERLEERMSGVSPESLRYKVLESAKQFKSSWVELGQYLVAVYKDKLYRDWGFSDFEMYCAKEIGIKQQTAVKLLKSYMFLEKEEPEYLKARAEEKTPTELPSYESVNALRLARQSDRIAEADYQKVRADVLEKGQEPEEVRKKIKYYLKPSEPKEVNEAGRKSAAAKKLTGTLESALSELSNLSFPNKVLKKVEELLDLLASYK
jgi:hypothetical protein